MISNLFLEFHLTNNVLLKENNLKFLEKGTDSTKKNR